MSDIYDEMAPDLIAKLVPESERHEQIDNVLKTLDIESCLDELDTGRELDQMVAVRISDYIEREHVRTGESIAENEQECYLGSTLDDLYQNGILIPDYDSFIQNEVNNDWLLVANDTLSNGTENEFYIYGSIEDRIADAESKWNELSEDDQAVYDTEHALKEHIMDDNMVSAIANAYEHYTDDAAFARFMAEAHRENLWSEINITKESLFDDHIYECIQETWQGAEPYSEEYNEILDRSFIWNDKRVIENALDHGQYADMIGSTKTNTFIQTPDESLDELVNTYNIDEIRDDLLYNLPLAERLYHSLENPDLMDEYPHQFEEVTDAMLEKLEFAKSLEGENRKAYIQEVVNTMNGVEMEAFELPSDLSPEFASSNYSYESALTGAKEKSMAQKDQDRDR